MKKYFFILLFLFNLLKLSIDEKVKLINKELIAIKLKHLNENKDYNFLQILKNYSIHFYNELLKEKERINKILNKNINKNIFLKIDMKKNSIYIINIFKNNEKILKEYFITSLIYPNKFFKNNNNFILEDIFLEKNKIKAEKNIEFIFIGLENNNEIKNEIKIEKIKHLKSTNEIIENQKKIKKNYQNINNIIIENDNDFEEEDELLKKHKLKIKKNKNFYNLILKYDCFKNLKNFFKFKFKIN